MIITTVNALLEALNEELPINKVFISTNRKDRRIQQVITECRRQRVVFQMVPQQTITRKAGDDNQGVFAEIAPIRFYELDEILTDIHGGLILVLDGIEDAGNMGALIRSAAAAEVDAVIVPQRHSAPINETVLKTSAGGLLKTRIVQCGNLAATVRKLKENSFWVAATVMTPGTSIPYDKYDFTANTAIIMGNEHKGTSPVLQKNADQLIHIPHSPRIESLNVSAAASVLLFEALRQRRAVSSAGPQRNRDIPTP